MSSGIKETIEEFRGEEDNILAATIFTPDTTLVGPPVLFMHGGGQTRHSWDKAARQMASHGLTTIAVDARGHGDSEWVSSKRYTFEQYRDDLIEVATEITKRFGAAPILVGASMGGISAMVAQAKAGPSIFAAIILVDITPKMDQTGVNKIMGFMAQNMKEGFATVEDAAAVIAAYLPNRPPPKSLNGLKKNLRLKDDGRWYWHWDPAFVESAMNISIGREERMEKLSEAASKISVPTLLVRGSQSELVTEEAVQEFLLTVPHAKFVDVTDAGHMVAGDKNDVFASAIGQFIREDVLTIQ